MLSNQPETFLNECGFNLVAVLDCANLPSDTREQLARENINVADYRRLVLIGSSGGHVWDQLQIGWMDRANPFDEYSVAVAEQFIHECLDDAPSQLFYPGPSRVSLIRLGELAGWSHPSPLGLGINPEFGLWFAYRAAFVTAAPLPVTEPSKSMHPCESCADKPCISACPAKAVRANSAFDITACYTFRVSPNASCVDRCHSRMACPIGREYQYPLAQIQHHYDLGRRVAD